MVGVELWVKVASNGSDFTSTPNRASFRSFRGWPSSAPCFNQTDMPSPLEDLDELVLRCLDEQAKTQIREAVACYRAGAFRASIVATWIAVCFDLIQKFRDLALMGDKEAIHQVSTLDTIIKESNLVKALGFEREILELAQTKFELISHQEFLDLKRLQEDRNRCAHPSMMNDTDRYQPAAELARFHLHCAVRYLLQHPPVQGKVALDSILQQIDSSYFPTDDADVLSLFKSKLLQRPRDSLVRNLLIVMMKRALSDDSIVERGLKRKFIQVINAVKTLHSMLTDSVFTEKLDLLISALGDSNLFAGLRFIVHANDAWIYLTQPTQEKFKRYVEHLPSDDFSAITEVLQLHQFKSVAQTRITKATFYELRILKDNVLPTEVVSQWNRIYLKSGSFDEANTLASHIATRLESWTEEAVIELLTKIPSNDQLTSSNRLPRFLTELRACGKVPAERFDQILVGQKLQDKILPEV
jgi:hypothetical protein